MSWYAKLNRYFTEEEMKAPKHFDYLLNHKSDIYKLDTTNEYVMLYAEFDSFIFVDYLYVDHSVRSKGIGKKLINKLKNKNKTIILEVEPPIEDDVDCTKRLKFYQREGFEHAHKIKYEKKSLKTGELVSQCLLYWSPSLIFQSDVYESVQDIYNEIHTDFPDGIYDIKPLPENQVVQWNSDGSNLFTSQKVVFSL